MDVMNKGIFNLRSRIKYYVVSFKQNHNIMKRKNKVQRLKRKRIKVIILNNDFVHLENLMCICSHCNEEQRTMGKNYL